MNTNKPTTMKILKGREKQGQFKFTFTLKPRSEIKLRYAQDGKLPYFG